MLVMLLLFLLLLVLVLVLAVLSDVPHTSPLRALSKVYSSEVRHGKLGTQFLKLNRNLRRGLERNINLILPTSI